MSRVIPFPLITESVIVPRRFRTFRPSGRYFDSLSSRSGFDQSRSVPPDNTLVDCARGSCHGFHCRRLFYLGFGRTEPFARGMFRFSPLFADFVNLSSVNDVLWTDTVSPLEVVIGPVVTTSTVSSSYRISRQLIQLQFDSDRTNILLRHFEANTRMCTWKMKCSEWILKPNRCTIKILRRATSNEFRNIKSKHVLQKWRKHAWEINSGVIKMYGTCQDERVSLKKEIREWEMTEYVCSRKYVRSTKDTFHFG